MTAAEMRPDSIQMIFSDLGGTSRAGICAAFGIDFPGRIDLLVAHIGLLIAEWLERTFLALVLMTEMLSPLRIVGITQASAFQAL